MKGATLWLLVFGIQLNLVVIASLFVRLVFNRLNNFWLLSLSSLRNWLKSDMSVVLVVWGFFNISLVHVSAKLGVTPNPTILWGWV